MQNLLIGLLIALGLFSYYMYNQNQTLTANNIKLESAVEEQKQQWTLRESYERQGKSLMNMSRRNAEIEAEKQEYLAIFANII